MARRSLGKLSKRTRLLGKTSNRLSVSKLVKSFNEGDRVVIDIKIRFSGSPHPRYRGRHGVIMEKRGQAYVVQIRDGNAIKKLIIPSVHLDKAQ